MTILGGNNLDLKLDDDRDGQRAGLEAETLAPPTWARQLVTGARRPIYADCSSGLESSVTSGPRGTLVSVRLRDAASAPADVLEARTVETYQLIRAAVASSENRWPVRVWNFIPHIHQPLDAERDRYMVFNTGRFKAYCDWFGGRENFPGRVPTASGVGHRGTDLAIHCLAVDRPGTSIENPRQVPAFGYSRRYGPQPPCFARGTLLPTGADRSHALLIGGTASIRGEQSMYVESLEQQTDETLANLASLIRAAAEQAGTTLAEDDESALATMRSMRVYHPRESDRDWIASTVSRRFPNAAVAAEIEFHRADLCRAELLIEIEGVARF